MRRRIGRLGVLVASVIGLIGGFVPPVEGTTAATVAFIGHAHVDGGTHRTIAYPCIQGLPVLPLPDPTLDTLGPLCLGLLTGLPNAFDFDALTDKGIPHAGYTNDHNPSGFIFNSDIGCVAAGLTIGKAGKLPVEAGLCDFTAAGVVLGHCLLGSGLGTGAIAPEIPPVGGNLQSYNVSFLFIWINNLLLINGEVTKQSSGTRGWLKGIAHIEVEPGSSCFNLDPLDFRISGGLTILIVT